jgi:sulfide:quinone oxidoreductase
MRRASVLVLGGGVGGVVAANSLRRRLPRQHRVVLVDRAPEFSFAASYLWVMTGARRPAQISRPLARLGRKGIEVVRGEIESIDPSSRSAVIDGRSVTADYLIVALGARFVPEVVPGLAEQGETFCTLDGAARLRAALGRFGGGRILLVTAEPVYKCPAAPYEAALLLDAELRRRGLRARTEIALHAAEPGPMAVAGAQVSAAVRAMMEDRGIRYRAEHALAAAEPGMARFRDGERVGFDLLVHVPPIRPPGVLAASGLSAPDGWVDVDRSTMATGFPGVYAVGDVTQLPLAVGKPLPRAGVFAHGQATVVAENIAAAVAGRSGSARFEGHGSCFVETGEGRAGFGSGDFFAEPSPSVRFRRPRRVWHWAKVLYEKQVLWSWF